MIGVKLTGIQYPQDFVEVTACAHRIGQGQFELLVRANQKDHADGGIVSGGAASGAVTFARSAHLIGLGNLELATTDRQIVQRLALAFLDVLGPFLPISHRIEIMPTILQFHFSNSLFRPARYPNSVVQTGAKPLGCEQGIAQLSPIHLWKWMVPWVASTEKFQCGIVNSECQNGFHPLALIARSGFGCNPCWRQSQRSRI
jgi:hypothetical protein